MSRHQWLAALTAAGLAATVIAAPAAGAAARPSCPSPTKADIRKSDATRSDHPPKGATALRGVRVGYLPGGFAYGQVTVARHDGLTEYSYLWSDNRDDVAPGHRSLSVRVICWPRAKKLSQLRDAPFYVGTFPHEVVRTATIGGRRVLVQEGDGALGAGRQVGWVEREGVVVTVTASTPLVPRLGRIVRGIKL
ncbi:hypothetical protein MF672_008560 [Actinomadura sp. ATCC 31491]|uniref:Uncharacterized protein n=1 Tax=Actinomadura luzonensis TaxID=2805427 RepID=A0ABT0FPA2_9ACTN|nr:hypothetical protein [Actinomadura luzonensis]MCK2213840.1 hypothetical protein [Actinomadura luzonensis]